MVAMVTGESAATLRHRREARERSAVRTAPLLTAPLLTAPLRLTTRGRVVATGVSALMVGVLSVTLATAAQATRDKPGSVHDYLAKVTVAPGDSLWSVAEARDPDADTRLVIERIRQLNSLTGDRLRPGEVLLVPRGLTGG